MYKKLVRGKAHYFTATRKGKQLTPEKKYLLLNLILILALSSLIFLLLNLFYPTYAINLTSNAIYQSKLLVSLDYKLLTMIILTSLIIIVFSVYSLPIPK